MSRIHDAFEKAAARERAALVIYLCAGDPTLELTADLVLAATEAGADVVELGVPFSDPTADGPTIQRASQRALAAGATLAGVLEVVRRVRKKSQVPIVLFGYVNPILSYGEEQLARDAKEAGVDGLLVVDLPPEECASLRDAALARGLDWVPLVAPTSTQVRVDAAAALATSFLYCVSMTGVTGSDAPELEGAAEQAARVGERTGKPVALGFGIRSAEDVRVAARRCDGVVVGSAVVRVVEAASSADEACRALAEKVRELATGCAR
ncbi:MAG: tryptophan synthase subunit alpha [Deltaproteobacteria bacterium]|nr:tryptophan synthase subunit alpha [Deltaproteobacteria bacterium]